MLRLEGGLQWAQVAAYEPEDDRQQQAGEDSGDAGRGDPHMAVPELVRLLEVGSTPDLVARQALILGF